MVENDVNTVDAYNITEYLASNEATRKISDNITVDQIQELVDMSDVLARNTLEEYKMLVQNILNAAFRRDTYQQLERCKSMCLDKSVENLGQQIYSIIDDAVGEYTNSDELPELKDVVDGLWDDIEARQHTGVGLEWQFPSLNDYVTLEPGELVVVAAQQKGGKSIFMMNSAVQALKNGKSVMYIDSELSDRLFLIRLISYLTGIEFSRIKYGSYSEEEREKIKKSIKWIKSQQFIHLYMPTFSSSEVYMTVMKAYHRFGGLGLLICDYLKATGDTGAWEVYAELGKVADTLKNLLCGALKIPGLAAAQLTATGKLADSAKIARNASTVLLLQDKTPDEIAEEGTGAGNKKLIVKYNRNGGQMVDGEWINLNFEGNYCRFSEAERHIPQVPY